jgi:ubiquinone/menaquinone biosynthesis C-methylase UbiE
MTSSVQIVFCMDTEGPCADPNNAELLANWELVDKAMEKLFTPEFRNKYPDTDGSNFKIGWFFLTWTGFKTNPRARDMGYHKIRDHYIARWRDLLTQYGDEHCWHYHHPPASGIGNEWGLDWKICQEFEQIISRQILEREWFPTCYRAGGTIMDPMSSRWVDSWFPFDYSNRAPLSLPGLVDWSTGIAEWAVYHPDVEDFRQSGAGRRRMARSLDLVTNVSVFADDDIEAAFKQAQHGQPAILSCFDHDYRDIADRIHDFLYRVVHIAKKYPQIPWQYAGPVEAIYQYLSVTRPKRLGIEIYRTKSQVDIWSTAPLFQSIPWLAMRTSDDQIHHIQDGIVRRDAQHWIWKTPPNLDWVEIGVAGSTELGASAVTKLCPDHPIAHAFLNTKTDTHPTHPRSIWEYTKPYVRTSIDRAANTAPEMDSIRQAVDLLQPHLESNMSVLDVGCGSGQAWHAFKSLQVDYHGIDSYARGIKIGQHILPSHGLPAHHLRILNLQDLPINELYDAIVCLSTLYYFPMYHHPLEIMARATKKWLIIRSSFGDKTEIRYLPDTFLEEGYQHTRGYFNIYSQNEIQDTLESEGFHVTWIPDTRQKDRFFGKPEEIAKISLPAQFLFAERIAPPPSPKDIIQRLDH